MYRRLGVIVAILAVSLCSPQVERSLALAPPADVEAPVPGDAKARLVEGYGAQPLHFERHEGQAGPNAIYIARGQGYGLLLTSDELTLTLKRGRRAPSIAMPGSLYADEAPAPGATVRVRLSGANPKARLTGLDPLPSRSNYFIGNDPAKWRTEVPHYAKVKLESVYPGIDLVFYGNGRQLEYDFAVAPGADPRQIRLAIDGAEKPAVKTSGDLGLPLPGGELTLQAPRVYQVAEGIQHRVPARFVVADNGQVGFEVENYDIARALVIDPVLSYSTYLGGSAPYFDNGDWGNAIAVDAAGNAYVAGNADSTDFPTTAGAFDRSGGYAGFVAKFGPTGALIYSTYLGGSAWTTEAHGIAVDADGNAYVTGETTNADFPTTPGAFQTTCAVGCSDAFVVKLNPTGSALLYSTYLGGPSDDTHFGDERGHAIALDSARNAYIAGWTRSNRFPVTAGAFQNTYAGGAGDVFVAKLNAAGSALVYATYLGGTGGTLWGDEPYAITVDSDGHAYVTGYTTSVDFPTTAGALQPANAGDTDVFITKLSADGSALVYSTYVGGTWHDYGGRGIAVDAAGNAYVTGGQVWSSDFPTTPGSYQPHCATTACADAFVLKLNPAGSALVWSTYLGGSAGEQGSAIALDAKGHVYVTGNTDSEDFPTRFPVQAYGGPGTFPWGDVFVTKLSADASRLLYSTYLGGTGDDAGFGIVVDTARNVYVTGGTSSSDFPTAAAAQSSNHGGIDAFVSKLAAITYNLTVINPVTGAGVVSSTPTGITCGSTCSAAFDQGERVTLTATATTGSTFTGWSGACTGTGACVVDMDQARSVTATFRSAPPTITVLVASPAAPQPLGTAITLTASVTGTAPQCKWLLTTDPTWATYTALRTWTACTTPAPWTPSVAGRYQVGLWARSSGNTTDAPEGNAAAVLAYTITGPVPPTITGLSASPASPQSVGTALSLSASPASPQSVGTALSLTATVTGGTSPQQCKWLLTTDPTWATYTTLRTWTACTTPAPWTPTVAGTYQLGLWARSSGNTVDYPEAAAVLAYTITGPVPP
ncbi:MAG: hypothetical protein H6Q86_3683, partial [candidate division NC10 bacterium]|nr:hypothetical protein [candidate division NC10 bacterium]